MTTPEPEFIDICQQPVLCNRIELGRDPEAAEPELAWPCSRCPHKVYVKPDFIRMGTIKVVCWQCFRAAGGRHVTLHPELVAELRNADRYPWALEAISEIENWLREPDREQPHRWEGLR